MNIEPKAVNAMTKKPATIEANSEFFSLLITGLFGFHLIVGQGTVSPKGDVDLES